MLAFKVVHRYISDDKIKHLFSSNQNLDKELQVEYKPDEWVEATLGFLFVFTTLDRAQVYCRANDYWHERLEIWECEIEQYHTPRRPCLPFVPDNDLRQIRMYWHNYRRWEAFTKSVYMMTMPPDTLLAKRVKILRICR